jgi:hypothetical protein
MTDQIGQTRGSTRWSRRDGLRFVRPQGNVTPSMLAPSRPSRRPGGRSFVAQLHLHGHPALSPITRRPAADDAPCFEGRAWTCAEPHEHPGGDPFAAKPPMQSASETGAPGLAHRSHPGSRPHVGPEHANMTWRVWHWPPPRMQG